MAGGGLPSPQPVPLFGSLAIYPIAAGIPVIMPDLQIMSPVVVPPAPVSVPFVVGQHHKDIKVEPVMPGALFAT